MLSEETVHNMGGFSIALKGVVIMSFKKKSICDRTTYPEPPTPPQTRIIKESGTYELIIFFAVIVLCVVMGWCYAK